MAAGFAVTMPELKHLMSTDVIEVYTTIDVQNDIELIPITEHVRCSATVFIVQ